MSEQPSQPKVRFGPKTKAFLAAIAATPNVSWAAAAVPIRRELHYRRLKRDPLYKAAFTEAWDIGCGALEDRAMIRAIEGVQEPVFWQGEECGHITRYYHTEFLLRGAMPKKYRERHEVEHTGTVTIVERLQAGRKRAAQKANDEPSDD